MHKLVFDFDDILTDDDFYIILEEQLELPKYFGRNLDALWDIATDGTLNVPMEIELNNLNDDDLSLKFFNFFQDLSYQLGGDNIVLTGNNWNFYYKNY